MKRLEDVGLSSLRNTQIKLATIYLILQGFKKMFK